MRHVFQHRNTKVMITNHRSVNIATSPHTIIGLRSIFVPIHSEEHVPEESTDKYISKSDAPEVFIVYLLTALLRIFVDINTFARPHYIS